MKSKEHWQILRMIVLEVHSTLQTVAFTGDICDPRFVVQTRVSLILTPPSQEKTKTQ